MTLENVINKFLDSSVHIYLNDGAYVDTQCSLIFNKFEHDRLFGFGYYQPDYKKWLMENSELKLT